jgi:hypothetical protein
LLAREAPQILYIDWSVLNVTFKKSNKTQTRTLSKITIRMTQFKYASFLLLSIVGNPFYQMISYIICSEMDLGAAKGSNVYQVNTLAFIFILTIIFMVRLLFFSVIFTSKEYPFSVKGLNSFLYIFSERHVYQVIGLVSFFVWIAPLEGNIIGFIVFPLTIILGLVVSIITLIRLLKTKKILITKSKQH